MEIREPKGDKATVEGSLRNLWKYKVIWEQSKPYVTHMVSVLPSWTTEIPSSVWAQKGTYGMAKNQPPIVIAVKPGAIPACLKQYVIPHDKRKGLQPIISGFLEAGILRKCHSPWNTPLYPVEKKEPGTYRPVQDLRAVNARVEPLAPLVEDPYTILSKLGPQRRWYTVLDLKDAFFTVRVSPISQPLFAFTWEQEDGQKIQITWTRLAQGFVHSPTLFSEALEKDLAHGPQIEGAVVLSYIDDLLLAGETEQACKEATIKTLIWLDDCGYKVSKEKAQMVQRQVTYLGFTLKEGQRIITPERTKEICSAATPRTRQGLRGFLGMCTYCRLWIVDFSTIAQPLYEATKGKDSEPLLWGPEQNEAFERLKMALAHGPALGLPDINKRFNLYVTEHKGVAKVVLTQTFGDKQRPCAYLSKRLDGVSQGWPGCLRTLASCCLLLHDAKKLTFQGRISVKSTHSLRPLLMEGGLNWMTNSRTFKYQLTLLEDPQVTLETCSTLNPATLLPNDASTDVQHDCVTLVTQQWKPRPDLQDQPLKQADFEWFTDGSSFVEEGIRKAGYAIIDHEGEIEAQALPLGTSAQLAELQAVIRACEMAEV